MQSTVETLLPTESHHSSDDLYRSVFEGMCDPILLLKNDRFVDCNAATLKMLGYTNKFEFLQHNKPAEISPAYQPDGLLSEEKASEMINTSLRNGFHRFEWTHSRVDKSEILVEVSLTPITVDGEVILHTLWRDITERKREEKVLLALKNTLQEQYEELQMNEESLRDQNDVLLATEEMLRVQIDEYETSQKLLKESEERHRAILQTAMDGFWLVDMNGRLLEVNETYCRMSGYNAQELMAMDINSLDATETVDKTADRIHKIMAQGEARFEVQHRRKDGSIMDVEVSVQYRPIEGGRLISFLRDITARKQAEVALRESEFFFRESQHAGSIGSYKTDFASDCWESSVVLDNIFGIDKEYDRRVQSWLDIVHPDDRVMMDRYLKEEVISKRKPFSKEYRIIRKKDGETRWVNGLGAATFDCHGNVTTLIGTIQDITERKHAEEKLILFKESVENSTDAIGMASTEGKHIYQNRSFTKMFDDFGDHPQDLFVDDSVGREMFNAITSGGQWVGEVKMYGKNKRVLDILLRSYANKDANGRIIGLVGIHTDITESKRSEEERINLEKQLLHTQKLESLGVLAGGIAHDFNNILTSIIGNVDLALMRINNESPVAGNLRKIEQAAARAADLSNQMLAYSGRGKFVVENIDLNHLLKDMLHMLEVSISKKAALRLNLHQHLPTVEADATQMRQIVMNLIINASEAIGEKSGVIAITTGCMDCDKNYLKNVWLDENITAGLYVYLEISDTGCGMNKKSMAKLFDPFFTTKFTGRGLGMAAVLGIVRGHKGSIKVYSEPGKGTTFKVLLPATNRPPKIFNDEFQKDGWQGNGTVLLVDDEESVRGIGKEMLQELGFDVITADDGGEAAEIYKSNHDIDFVIMDLTMPHMDGEQCFRELRRLKPDVKVIMSSGYNEQEVTQKFVGKGLAGFIQKPYKLSVLKEAIRRVMAT
jgi:two-component system cell cycle sensor histidine kinase/response regulator CckA